MYECVRACKSQEKVCEKDYVKSHKIKDRLFLTDSVKFKIKRINTR